MNSFIAAAGNVPESIARPPIVVLQSEAEALIDLAVSAVGTSPMAAELLLQELDRARTAKPGKLPGDVVSMGSHVLFVDEASQTRHGVQLVYPREADASSGRVSVLTLIGAALIGMRRDGVINWPDRSGRCRLLRILHVAQPPRPVS